MGRGGWVGVRGRCSTAHATGLLPALLPSQLLLTRISVLYNFHCTHTYPCPPQPHHPPTHSPSPGLHHCPHQHLQQLCRPQPRHGLCSARLQPQTTQFTRTETKHQTTGGGGGGGGGSRLVSSGVGGGGGGVRLGSSGLGGVASVSRVAIVGVVGQARVGGVSRSCDGFDEGPDGCQGSHVAEACADEGVEAGVGGGGVGGLGGGGEGGWGR